MIFMQSERFSTEHVCPRASAVKLVLLGPPWFCPAIVSIEWQSPAFLRAIPPCAKTVFLPIGAVAPAPVRPRCRPPIRRAALNCQAIDSFGFAGFGKWVHRILYFCGGSVTGGIGYRTHMLHCAGEGSGGAGRRWVVRWSRYLRGLARKWGDFAEFLREICGNVLNFA